MSEKNVSGRSRKIHQTEKGRAKKDEREVVLLALLSYEKNKTFSNVLVRRTLDDCSAMSTAERGFIKRLLEGVIERGPELDAGIVRLTGRPVKKLHPAVYQILRMGLYQIWYMDAVPDSAACNEAVLLAKRHAPARLSGFVNGVLRNAARERAAEAAGRPLQPAKAAGKAGHLPQTGEKGEPLQTEEDRIRDLEFKYSMPAWIVRMWEDLLGQAQTEDLLASLLEIRPVCARLCHGLTRTAPDLSGGDIGGNTCGSLTVLMEELRLAGAVVERGRWHPDSFRLRRTSDLRRLPGFMEGRWTVQDESSMLAVEAAGLTGSETVLDLCAAPGGKTFLAAEKLLQGGGTVRAFDLSRRKTDRIREGADRLHLPDIVVGERDARVFYPADEACADVVLCDLPCSGLGVIGKKRDIKYRASLEGIRSLQKLQREILRNAVRYLKPGGVLVYSTCTISAPENEENAAWIREELGLHPEDLAPFLPEGLPGIRGNMLQLLPHVHDTDGFFMARFRR